ncbi:MAG: hypothetical protein JWO10_1566 [Microbacteriaceae bacterium]|nr:hypothetical protein [Microbacteriaceae bacterium]
MTSEKDLRDMLQRAADNAKPRDIDTGAVLRRSRRGHRAKQLVVGGATTLAVVGIGVASVGGIRSIVQRPGPMNLAGGSAASSEAAPDGAAAPQLQKRAPAEKINLCGGQLAEVSPAASGLVLSVKFANSAAASADSVSGAVTMTNTGTQRVSGTTAATPAITLSRDGITLWHSNGAMIMMAAVVDLEPGASMTYNASFVPVSCSTEDESAPSFRQGLEHVAAGDYQLSAAIDFSPDSTGGSAELVTSPLVGIHLG